MLQTPIHAIALTVSHVGTVQLADFGNFYNFQVESRVLKYPSYQANFSGLKMPLEKFDGLELPATADFHVHLRDGEMMELVTPTIRQGGVNTVFVMVCNTQDMDGQELTFNCSRIWSHP